jgi:hypothetical protein
MAEREGWKQLSGHIPMFAQEELDALREVYADVHGVPPGPTQVIAALIHAATPESVLVALLEYRSACRAQGVDHGL